MLFASVYEAHTEGGSSTAECVGSGCVVGSAAVAGALCVLATLVAGVLVRVFGSPATSRGPTAQASYQPLANPDVRHP